MSARTKLVFESSSFSCRISFIIACNPYFCPKLNVEEVGFVSPPPDPNVNLVGVAGVAGAACPPPPKLNLNGVAGGAAFGGVLTGVVDPPPFVVGCEPNVKGEPLGVVEASWEADEGRPGAPKIVDAGGLLTGVVVPPNI
jgi:hypothetical protein